MQFTREEIKEFKAIFEKSYNKKISFELAEKFAYYFYNLHKVLYDTLEKKVKMDIKVESQKKKADSF